MYIIGSKDPLHIIISDLVRFIRNQAFREFCIRVATTLGRTYHGLKC